MRVILAMSDYFKQILDALGSDVNQVEALCGIVGAP